MNLRRCSSCKYWNRDNLMTHEDYVLATCEQNQLQRTYKRGGQYCAYWDRIPVPEVNVGGALCVPDTSPPEIQALRKAFVEDFMATGKLDGDMHAKLSAYAVSQRTDKVDLRSLGNNPLGIDGRKGNKDAV